MHAVHSSNPDPNPVPLVPSAPPILPCENNYHYENYLFAFKGLKRITYERKTQVELGGYTTSCSFLINTLIQ